MRRDLRQTALHPSLIRPILLGGAEREPVLVNVILIFALVLGVGPHPLTFLLAITLGTLGHSALVWAARHDSQIWKVYSRHLRYRRFYPARSRFDARLSPIHPFNERQR
ncbi:MAG: VirB3 family type IV secretion system protein [Acidimicrobiia bacterium]|nr:VirB3 family type IV secretion system protein [Acidimicrobiia bacterium]